VKPQHIERLGLDGDIEVLVHIVGQQRHIVVEVVGLGHDIVEHLLVELVQY
jgi:hypothetical protein